MIPKRCKTPLRYPGGKSRATKKMFEYLPDMGKIKRFHEGFLGGGSVAFAFARLYPHKMSVCMRMLDFSRRHSFCPCHVAGKE